MQQAKVWLRANIKKVILIWSVKFMLLFWLSQNRNPNILVDGGLGTYLSTNLQENTLDKLQFRVKMSYAARALNDMYYNNYVFSSC